MNSAPKSAMAMMFVLLAMAAALVSVFAAFTATNAASKDVTDGYTNCGTGQQTDVGCYYQHEASQRWSYANRASEIEAAKSVAIAFGAAAVTLGACAVAFGTNRAPKTPNVPVSFPQAPGTPGAAPLVPPQPAPQMPLPQARPENQNRPAG